MAKSQHTFSKRQREKAKQKKTQEKMQRREERKHEKGGGLEIDWGSAPTEKTLTVNDIDPTELENEDTPEGTADAAEKASDKPEDKKDAKKG